MRLKNEKAITGAKIFPAAKKPDELKSSGGGAFRSFRNCFLGLKSLYL